MKECKTIKKGISAVAHVCSTGNALQVLQTLFKGDEIPLCFSYKKHRVWFILRSFPDPTVCL